ncbi:MAG: hypothetical protein AAB074_01685 [Planctomycetota bacterium]
MISHSFAERPLVASLEPFAAMVILTEPKSCRIHCPTLDWDDFLKTRRWLCVWKVPPGKHKLLFESNGQVVERVVVAVAGETTQIGLDLASGRSLDIYAPQPVDALIPRPPNGGFQEWEPDSNDPESDAEPTILDLAVCDDGSLVVSCDRARRVRLWRKVSNLPSGVARGADSASSVAISPSGSHIAASDFNHRIWVWDVAARRRVAVFEDAHGAVLGVAVGPEGKWAAAVDSKGYVHVWDVHNSRLIWSRWTGARGANDVCMSVDGKMIAVATFAERPIQLYGTVTGDLLEEFGDGGSGATHIALCSNPQTVLAILADRSTVGWSRETREPLNLGEFGRKAAGARDDRLVFSASETGRVATVAGGKAVVFQLLGKETKAELVRAVGDGTAVALSRDGKTVVVGDSKGEVRFLELK